ncbi:signal peptidase I [Thermococcus sp.]|uniref:signal peptidase I n=1 Tax=Thermococcus sp. TaxID=35749 RepID=UPI00263933D0|nr:signal peptidase I [Thermococcus sp.]
MKKLIEAAFALIVIIFILGSAVGYVLDRPVFISYAYSGSMTPTIDKGDLFIMNPFARSYHVGDIIVFHRRTGWTVHRIFAVTDEGFITKGDNNVATDQENGLYPPVKPRDIAGKVVVVMGHPLVIRGGGTFIENLRSKFTNVYAVIVLLIIGAILTFSGDSKVRRRKKKFYRLKVRTLYAVLSVLLIGTFLFVTVASWGTLSFSYSSTLAGGQRAGWHLPGSVFEQNLTVKNNAVYPFYYFIGGGSNRTELLGESSFRLSGGSSKVLMVRVNVPLQTRIYVEKFTVRSYPAILPGSVVSALYGISPYAPLVPYAILMSVMLFGFYRLAGIGDVDVIRIRRRGGVLYKILGWFS